jgi:hypothetical protein
MKKHLIIWGLALVCAFGFAEQPQKLYGVYVSRWTMMLPSRLQNIVDKSVEHNMNAIVLDYNGETGKLYLDNLEYARSKNLYLIARVEVFPDAGADFTLIRDQENWQRRLRYARQAEKLGFDEVQLDYVRFQDAGGPSLEKKQWIEKFLAEARTTLNIPLQADIFGATAYHPHLIIGQDINGMGNYVSAVCPMLYPSHFNLDRKRMSQPYETMLEGCTLAQKQINGRPIRLIPYIQAFSLRISLSGLTLKDYIIAQVKATEAANTNGFFVWNAENNYSKTWEALTEHPINKEKLLIFF